MIDLTKILCFLFISLTVTSCTGSTNGVSNNIGDAAALLQWERPTENIDLSSLGDLTGYRIYYSDRPDEFIDKIIIDDPNQLSYRIENLNSSSIYYFAISSVNSQNIESGLYVVSKIM